MINPIKLFKEQYKAIVITGLISALLFLLISLLFPLQYRADSQLIVITKGEEGVDAYTAMRSSEKIGESLMNIVETNDFFAKVASNVENDKIKEKFSGVSEQERRETWSDTVDASLNYGTGMLSVSTYDKDPAQAKKLNKKVLEALLNETEEYVGQKVNLKVVNPPLVTKYPVKPNLLINTVIGFVIGLISSFGYLWFKRKQEHHFLFS